MTASLNAFEVLPESTLREAVDLMVRLIEACGAVVIMIGAVVAIAKFVVALGRRNINQFSSVRLTLARFLVLGLEFQLAADVLRTAISPSFAEIGKLEGLLVDPDLYARDPGRFAKATVLLVHDGSATYGQVVEFVVEEPRPVEGDDRVGGEDAGRDGRE